MRILMLGNSFTFANQMPRLLAQIAGCEVVAHTRGGARLAEHLNPGTQMGSRTQRALREEKWDFVVLQEMSNGPITAPGSFFSSVSRLCTQIRENGAVPVLFATWAYASWSADLKRLGMDYDEMHQKLRDAYLEAARQNGARIAQVGEQFYARSAGEELYASDGVHPNERGSRIAAETIWAQLQGSFE